MTSRIKFLGFPLSVLYVYELRWLCESIKWKCESIFTQTETPKVEELKGFSPKIHSLIFSVLTDAANIKKLIQDRPQKLKRESDALYQLRLDRTKLLSDYLEGLNLNEMLNNKVRNTIEHFDEYLDEEILRLSNMTDEELPSPLAAYNIIMPDWDALITPRPYPIRLYIMSERTFYNMRWSINIGEVYKEALSILERLELKVFKGEPFSGRFQPLTWDWKKYVKTTKNYKQSATNKSEQENNE